MDCALSSAPGHQVALLEPTATVASGDADCDASISNARESDQLGGDGAVFDDSDDYISCDDCECLYDGDCPEHGPLNIIRDVKVPVGEPDRARRTVPRQLAILPSKIEGAGEGVWTREPLPRRTRFGPYEGTIRPTHTETGYGWEVVRFGKAIHCIDASDVRTSNWVRYVNCARNVVEENLHSFQYKGQLYYRTTCDVPAHTELLVWYGDSYGQELGIDPESFHKPVDKPECLSGTFPCGDCYLAFVSPLLLEKHKRHSHCIAELRRRRAAGGVHPTKDSQTALKPSSPSKQCPSKPSGSSIQCQPSKSSESSKQWRPSTPSESSKQWRKSTPSESSKQWRPSTPSESSKQWRPSKPSEASKPSESSKQCHPPKPSESSRSWRPSKPLESSKPSESSRLWRPSKPSESSTSWRPSKPPEQKASSSPADQKVRTSDACGKTLEERRSLIISKRSVLPAVVFSCEVCSAPHPSIERLRTHMSIHNSETPFKCRKCDAAFKLRACLVRHMWIHADKKPWKCKICEESFGEAAHLQRHMRAHTNEKLYVCQTCDATFSFRKDFIRHLFTHTAKKSIPCPTCDLTFSSEIRLKKHMLSHSEETLFKCRYCIAYLRDESSLIKHMLAHNRKDPLKCITREAAFNQPNQMPHTK